MNMNSKQITTNNYIFTIIETKSQVNFKKIIIKKYIFMSISLLIAISYITFNASKKTDLVPTSEDVLYKERNLFEI